MMILSLKYYLLVIFIQVLVTIYPKKYAEKQTSGAPLTNMD